MKYSLHQWYLYAYGLMCFSLPFEGVLRVVPNLILILLVVLFPFVIKKESLVKLKNKAFITFCILFLFTIFIFIFNETFLGNLSMISNLTLIMLVYILHLPLHSLEEVKKMFISGVFVAVLISISSIGIYILNEKNFVFSNGEIISKILITERVYLAYMVVLSMVLSLDMLKVASKIKYMQYFLIANIIISFLFILLVAARMSLISILIIFFYNIIILKKYKSLVLITITGLLILSFMFFINENLKNRFFYSDKSESFIENFKKWEPRVVIWGCVYELYKSNSDYNKLVGYSSFNKTNKELVNCYKGIENDKVKQQWFLKARYNTHNQFLDFLLSTGVLGLMIFISIFGILFSDNIKNRIYTSLLITCLLFCLVENVFHRQVGLYLFAFVLITTSNKKYKVINE